MKYPGMFIISLLYLLPMVGYAQKVYPTGLILDDAAYDRLPSVSKNIQIGRGQKSISAKVDLSPYCPDIRHQGDIASCVGWSAGYAAMTIERAIKNNWTDKKYISENANSALFIYNQIIEGNCDLGVTMPQALDLMKEKGNCLARDFDIDPNNCVKEISESILNKAASYKIEDYIPLFQKDAPSEEKVKNTKLVLAQKKPVIVGMRVLQNFYNIRPGDESWFPTLGNTGYAGGHAMVVVGYDDERFSRPGQEISAEMRGGFKLMNSWGKNWGENGFIWIRYAHFGEFCRHAYAIMLADGPPIDFNLDMTTAPVKAEEITQEREDVQLKAMAGSFGFRQYMGKSSEGYHVFEEAGIRLDDDFYTLEGSQKAGDVFQLYVQSGFENGYIYVFSVDPLGKAEVHFPKSQEYIESFEGEEESAMLVSGGSVLTIPAVDSGLRFTHPGKDHLIVLFSTQKVRPKYLEYLCNQLSSNKENLKTHLFQLLEKYMIPLADITYQQENMGFEVSTRSDGKIVPILLTVSVR